MPFWQDIYYSSHSGAEAGMAALVMIHGAGGSHLSWPPQLRRLPGFHTYALDLPGHGKSSGEGFASVLDYTRSVQEWMDGTGLSNAVIAGHSMGSAVALTLARAHPDRVAGLVLIGAGGRLRVHPDLLRMSGQEQEFQAVVSLVTRWSYAAQTPPALVELASRRLSEVDPLVLHRDFLACDWFDLLDNLEEIDRPALVICGVEDQLTPLKYAQYLVTHLPKARLAKVEGAGHMVMLEKPAETAEAMVEFLESMSGWQDRPSWV